MNRREFLEWAIVGVATLLGVKSPASDLLPNNGHLVEIHGKHVLKYSNGFTWTRYPPIVITTLNEWANNLPSVFKGFRRIFYHAALDKTGTINWEVIDEEIFVGPSPLASMAKYIDTCEAMDTARWKMMH